MPGSATYSRRAVPAAVGSPAIEWGVSRTTANAPTISGEAGLERACRVVTSLDLRAGPRGEWGPNPSGTPRELRGPSPPSSLNRIQKRGDAGHGITRPAPPRREQTRTEIATESP